MYHLQKNFKIIFSCVFSAFSLTFSFSNTPDGLSLLSLLAHGPEYLDGLYSD